MRGLATDGAAVTGRLARLRRIWLAVEGAASLLTAGSVCLIGGALLIVAEAAFYLPPALRTAALAAVAVAALSVSVTRYYHALGGWGVSLRDVALSIERRLPALHPQLVTAVDVEIQKRQGLFSPELIASIGTPPPGAAQRAATGEGERNGGQCPGRELPEHCYHER